MAVFSGTVRSAPAPQRGEAYPGLGHRLMWAPLNDFSTTRTRVGGAIRTHAPLFCRSTERKKASVRHHLGPGNRRVPTHPQPTTFIGQLARGAVVCRGCKRGPSRGRYVDRRLS
jgi:hypothetical protein